LWPVLAVLGLAAAAYFVWQYFGQTGNYTYISEKVTKGSLTVTVTATGTVQPVALVEVSSEISGIVRKVNVDYNSPVKKGSVLAELDKSTLEASAASARASLAVANANVAKAKVAANAAASVYERQLNLFERKVISKQAFEDAENGVATAHALLQAAAAELLVAQANLQMAETSLSRAVITSPIDGVVLTRSVDEGSTVAASLQAPVLFTLAVDLSQMEVQVDVDEADIGGVKIGQLATFTVDAYRNRSFPAEITDIRYVSETINNVVTYKATLNVDNAELLLRPGMTATADIVTEKYDSALLVPNAALRYTPPAVSDGGGGIFDIFRPPDMDAATTAEPTGTTRTIWVLHNALPAKVAVEIGASDGQNTIVTSGEVTEGEDAIVDAVAAE
jgi:HlyD family secretion protein